MKKIAQTSTNQKSILTNPHNQKPKKQNAQNVVHGEVV